MGRGEFGRSVCGLGAAALFLSLALLCVFDFTVAAPATAASLYLFSPAFGDVSDAACAGMVEVGAGGAVPDAADAALRQARLLSGRYGLSSREEQIVAYVAQGYNAPYIAQRLMISNSTVRSHLRVVYQKVGVGSHMELVDLLRHVGS